MDSKLLDILNRYDLSTLGSDKAIGYGSENCTSYTNVAIGKLSIAPSNDSSTNSVTYDNNVKKSRRI